MNKKLKEVSAGYRLNMDFEKPVCMLPEQYDWVSGPADGVSRVPLERLSPESGHKTGFVRFSPGSYFPAHAHPLGEEIYVLDGVFSDQHGDYPAGSWIRSPHLSEHFPRVKEKTLILVKAGHLPPSKQADNL